MDIRVQTAAFAPGAELDAFTARQTSAGAVVSFSGVVRDVAGGLLRMEIEHYPGMTESAISVMTERAIARFELTDATVIHRHGALKPGEVIMMVLTAAPHRKAAFDGAEFLMDYLKSRAPFWKKEVTSAGATWVASTCEDEAALKEWD